jgi:hypothetical protein
MSSGTYLVDGTIHGPSGAYSQVGPQGPVGSQGDQGPVWEPRRARPGREARAIRAPLGAKALRARSEARVHQGPVGSQGPQGPVGSQGDQAPSGAKACQARSEARVIRAPLGAKALRARSEARAISGPVGSQGLQGPVGSQGAAGPRWEPRRARPGWKPGCSGPRRKPRRAQGPVGSQGAVGPVGSQGPQGPVGSQGAGPVGSQGVPGPVGSQGAVGPVEAKALRARSEARVQGPVEARCSGTVGPGQGVGAREHAELDRLSDNDKCRGDLSDPNERGFDLRHADDRQHNIDQPRAMTATGFWYYPYLAGWVHGNSTNVAMSQTYVNNAGTLTLTRNNVGNYTVGWTNALSKPFMLLTPYWQNSSSANHCRRPAGLDHDLVHRADPCHEHGNRRRGRLHLHDYALAVRGASPSSESNPARGRCSKFSQNISSGRFAARSTVQEAVGLFGGRAG